MTTENKWETSVRRTRWIILSMILTVLLSLLFFSGFTRKFVKMETAHMEAYLEKTTMEEAVELRGVYEYRRNTLEQLAKGIQSGGIPKRESVLSALHYTDSANLFLHTGLVNASGEGIDSVYDDAIMWDSPYFKRALEGELSIWGVASDQVKEDYQVQIMMLPIFSENREVIGAVYGVWKVESSGEEEADSPRETYFHVVRSDGGFVYRSTSASALANSRNIWEILNRAAFQQGSLETLKSSMAAMESGLVRFTLEGQRRTMYYMPLDIGDCHVCMFADEGAAEQHFNQVNQLARRMLRGMTVAYLLVLLVVFYAGYRARRLAEEAAEQSAGSLALMRLALHNADQVVFEYDPECHRLTFTGGSRSAALGEGTLTDFPASYVASGRVRPDSAGEFCRIFEAIDRQESSAGEVELKTRRRDFCWYQVELRNVYNSAGQRINTVGLASNIDRRKREELSLRRQAERDHLTGLYNLAALREAASALLNQEEGCGSYFLMLDVDHFKQINDTFGHQFGNEVLRDVARALTKKFRGGDVIARLGGDEFGALIRHIDEETLCHRAEELRRELFRTYEQGGLRVESSVSIGITEASLCSGTVDDLLEQADRMLYQVKKEKKNGWAIHSESNTR